MAAEASVPPIAAPASGWLWRMAVIAPMVLLVPWLFVTGGLPAPAGTVSGLLLALLLVTVTTTDLIWRRIPNWATYTTVVWVFLLHLLALLIPAESSVKVPTLQGLLSEEPAARTLLVALLGLLPITEAMLGFVAGFGIMLLVYSVARGGGAGDVKLMAACGAILGLSRVFEVIVYGFVACAVYGACYVVWTAGPWALVRELARLLLGKPSEPGVESPLKARFAMAPFFTLGVLLAFYYRT